MKKIFIFTISIFLWINIFAHSGKPNYHIIIDTDGAIDDMRSISMLLSANDVRVLAICCSQGSLMPETIFIKVVSLLKTFHNEGIPVGISKKTEFKLPVWSGFAKKIKWSDSLDLCNNRQKIKSIELLNKTTKDYQDEIILIALGSLKTYADWIKSNHKIKKKIKKIIWYNDINLKNGFNYQISPESYSFIKKSGISLEIVSNKENKLLINKTYLDIIKNTNSIYAKHIYNVHSQSCIAKKIEQKHLKLWDDLVPLYLTVPILFKSTEKNNVKFIFLDKNIPEIFIFKTIKDILVSSTRPNNRVFINFPVDTTLYKNNYKKITKKTIKKYGLIEWKAICLTNEIHGHTGIYSIIGAKMGVRAMEYFNLGVNNLKITSFAGKTPPLSCFNDGLQISTGATIGQGLITVSDSILEIPTAIFEFNNQKIEISLKPKIAKKLQDDIKFGVENYGLLTDQYWLFIEKKAIEYWTKYSRHKIFSIEKI